MAIDLLSLKPHQVSRDLSGYITYIYGEAKTGKTTFASQMPQPLLLAFEKGYNALPGIIVQDVTSWGEMKQVVRELKKDAVKEQFKSVIVDTIDVAGALCEKYVCGQLGIQEIEPALQCSFKKGSAIVAGTAGHVIRRHVRRNTARRAQADGKTAGQVQKHLRHKIASISQGEVSVFLALPDQLIVSFLKEIFKIDQVF